MLSEILETIQANPQTPQIIRAGAGAGLFVLVAKAISFLAALFKLC